MKRQSEEIVREKLKDIINQLTDLSEGYLNQEDFENDPEASMKSSIDGLIDSVKEVILIDMPDIYRDFKN